MTDLTPIPPHELVSAPPDVSSAILAGYLAESSMRRYTRVFEMYRKWCQAASSDPTAPASLAAWRATMANDTTWSPNTINQRLDVVKRIMAEAGQRGYISNQTAEAFKAIRRVSVRALRDRLKQHSRTRISPADMRRLCNAPPADTLIGMRDRALLATLASAGLRESEAATLTIGQIETHPTGYMLAVLGKTDTEPRACALSDEAYQLIHTWLDRRSITTIYIFTSFAGRGNRPNDTPMSATSVWRVVQAYARACDLAHIKPHDFRRFVGTQIAAKHGIRAAQKVLGHRNINTTASAYVLDDLEPGITNELY